MGERGGRLRRRRLGGFWRGGGAGFPIESLALRSQAGWLCHFAWWGVGDRNVPPPFCLVGVRVGKAGFWREIEGGWKFSFEIQVETREKIVPPDKP